MKKLIATIIKMHSNSRKVFRKLDYHKNAEIFKSIYKLEKLNRKLIKCI